MNAMDVDEGSNATSPRLALIRAVRTLDDDGSLPAPDKIHRLWLLITAAKATRLHGVEESILRWLLKQMTGNNDAAEHVRRYPLTWTILAHVIPQITAQSLGRSLSYLRFVTVLNKTLEQVTTPQDSKTTAPKKRKKHDAVLTTLEDLRTSEGCLKTAGELFKALAILLEQTNAHFGEVTPERRVGAEHIKSLFSSAADETREITTKLLLLCSVSLETTDLAPLEDQQSWVETLSSIWSLRLHSKEDSLEFASHLYRPASSILARLNDGTEALPSHIKNTCRDTWSRQLERFLNIYFIRPARQRFSMDKNVDMLKMALAAGAITKVPSATVMWDLAARTPRKSTNFKSKTEHAAWVDTIFDIILATLESLPSNDYNKILVRLLDTALQADSIPNNNTLRKLYQTNALASKGADWTLVAKIIACDPDVFLADQSSETIFHRIGQVSTEGRHLEDTIVTDVIMPLQDAYANARNLVSFVQKWFEALCTAKSVETSLWLDKRIRSHLAGILQNSLSSPQILRLLEALEPSDSQRGELFVILDGICAGLTDENTIDNVEPKIFSLAFPEQETKVNSPELLASRWRVIGYLATWETSKEFKRLWKEIKSDLKSTLKKGSMANDDTLEAFSCCYQVCLANHIGGKYEEEPIKLLSVLIERLEPLVVAETDVTTYQPFLDVIFKYLPRLCEQPHQGDSDLAKAIAKIFWALVLIAPIAEEVVERVQPLIHNHDVAANESLSDALMALVLDELDGPGGKRGWTNPGSRVVVLVLLQFPLETWTRGRRKRIMASWKQHKSSISSLITNDPDYAMAIKRLLVKVMQQPTSYEGMAFADLVDVCSNTAEDNMSSLALTDRFIEHSVRQVMTNINDSTPIYLRAADEWVRNLEPRKDTQLITHTILLKHLVAALFHHKASHPTLRRVGVEPQAFGKKLAEMVERLIHHFLASVKTDCDKSMLTLSNYPSVQLFIEAARVIDDAGLTKEIKPSDDMISDLQSISNDLVLRGAALGWRIWGFLARHCPGSNQLDRLFLKDDITAPDEDSVNDFVDAFVQSKDQLSRDQILSELAQDPRLSTETTVPLLAIKRLLELHKGSKVDATQGPGILDLARIHVQFTSLLTKTKTLSQFRIISDITLLLLDKYSSAMSQYNIEAALVSVVEVCSAQGPRIEGPRAAGEIFSSLFKLVALIIKRHRLRISGHFHILLFALRALLTVLLADPSTSTSKRPIKVTQNSRKPRQNLPPWLHTRLQARHGERFARLLTLICEPSAASVARHSSSGNTASASIPASARLDSATDAAKRAAGQYMYIVLEVYIKLQLDAAPSASGMTREMRRALEVGFFSVLNITSEGGRRVLNESLDASGRALFRALFADYRKFGKWKGV